MKRQHFPTVLVLPVIAVFLSIPAAASPSDCHRISESSSRLACYDRETGRTIPGTDKDRSSQASPAAVKPAATVDRQAESFGLGPELRQDALSMVADVTSVSRNAYGKLEITLANEQVWHQLDTGRLPLRVGDAVVIEEASLGSFLLEKRSGSRRIRVKRVL
ncbi:MAG: hypothetical protein O3B72_07250 [Proteobacteria bacterium]|nr:hypothetical protein [Pseudomonadota bacterium]